MKGFSLKGLDKTAIQRGFTPSDAYPHKDTRELVKNDEIAKAICDNALSQATELAKKYVLVANNGVAFTDVKKDTTGKATEFTPRIVVKVSPRTVQDTEFVMTTNSQGFPEVKKNPDGSPMTKGKTEMKNGKEVPVYRPVRLEELPESQQSNKGNLYSTLISYTLKGQQVQIFASVKVEEENGKPQAEVKFVTPIVSQYSQNKADFHRVKGIEEINEEINNDKSWIKSEMKVVLTKILESGIIAEKTSSETFEYAKSLNERFENGLKVEITKRERDDEGKIIYDEIDGRRTPRLIQGETEKVPMCSARTFKNTLAEGVQIYNRESSNIVVEFGSYKGTDGTDRHYTKVTDWDLTYPLNDKNELDKDAEPIERTEKTQVPVSQTFNTAEGIVCCTPPIPELHEILAERLSVEKEEYAQIYIEAYGTEPTGDNGFGDKYYGSDENDEVAQPVQPQSTSDTDTESDESDINPNDFEEILDGGDIPF